MAHVAKYTRGALGHMFAHYERAKGKDNECILYIMLLEGNLGKINFAVLNYPDERCQVEDT